MNDTIDTIFRWRCPNCGRMFEEGNYGALEAKKQMHEKSCTGTKRWEHKEPPPRIHLEGGKQNGQ